MGKDCNNCTKCCEGWLSTNVNGHEISPGNPCYFLEINKGCKIYETRPEEPCKRYFCGWRSIEEMPEEFKPDKSGVIMHKTRDNYLAIIKAPNNPTPHFLSWAIVYARSRNENIVWYIDDKSWWIGDEEFCREMEKLHAG